MLDTPIILGGSKPAQGDKAGIAVSADDAPLGGSGTDKAARTPGKPSTAKSSRQEAATGVLTGGHVVGRQRAVRCVQASRHGSSMMSVHV